MDLEQSFKEKKPFELELLTEHIFNKGLSKREELSKTFN